MLSWGAFCPFLFRKEVANEGFYNAVMLGFLILLGSVIFVVSKPDNATANSVAPPSAKTGAPGEGRASRATPALRAPARRSWPSTISIRRTSAARPTPWSSVSEPLGRPAGGSS